MALIFIGNLNEPNYIALSTDVADNKIVGASNVGQKVLLTDSGDWKVILSDLTLGDYAMPASFSGSITLGTVAIDQTPAGTSNGVVVGVSAVVPDGLGNYGTVLTSYDGGGVSSAPLMTTPLAYNGASWDKPRTASVFKDLAGVAITTIATVWTPASGKKFRLMGGSFSVSGACSVLFEDNAAATTIIRTPLLEANKPYSFDLLNGILSGAANRVLKATASTGTVTITGHLYGTEE